MRFAPILLLLCIHLRWCIAVCGSELDDAKLAYRSGDYEKCIAIAKPQVEKRVWNEKWPILLMESYLTTGEYKAAQLVFEDAQQRFGDSLRFRLLGVQVYRMNNLPLPALEQLEIIDAMTTRSPWRYTNSLEIVPLGQYLLLQGVDPKVVLKSCFDQALKLDPSLVEAHVATAAMALEKNDDKVASQSLAKAMKLDDKDPEVHYLSAKAWRGTDPERATIHLQKSLELNAKYLPSLLLAAEEKMNSEQYQQAIEILDRVEAVNPRFPVLWALRAAISHLTGQYEQEGEFRKKALEPWALNPEVDHTIGRHLSMHYRFSESVEYQRRALVMSPKYLAAQTQLAQDLLRLGYTEDGWNLVDIVRQTDPYDVTVFNLKKLQKELELFETIEFPGFVVRMDKREARIYGEDVVRLLSDARETLTQKYSTKLEEPIFVEIFPKQRDFAIRTFGLPGGQGFLGVCFGRLITANSPAALQVDSNWKSVLWHEYCHVVTLQKTKNRMPRWLSEGISVYEELQKNKTWGQSMDPTYREMILGEDFVPISQLSGAFLSPKTPLHLQFAYFESAMAVEFFIAEFGMPAMQKLLDDLSIGMPIQDALRRAPGTLEALDKQFEDYAKARANQLGSKVDWSRPSKEDKEVAAWATNNPNAYWSIASRCKEAMKKKNWEEALPLAEQWRDAWPDDHRNDGAYGALSAIYREQKQPELERNALVSLVERSSDAVGALERLSELDSARSDWSSVADWCERLQAIQPLRFELQQKRAQANEKLGRWEIAARAWRACLDLDPLDPAWIHFKIAMSEEQLKNAPQAIRHALLALEESPRFIDALRLLKRVKAQVLMGSNSASDSVPQSTDGNEGEVDGLDGADGPASNREPIKAPPTRAGATN